MCVIAQHHAHHHKPRPDKPTLECSHARYHRTEAYGEWTCNPRDDRKLIFFCASFFGRQARNRAIAISHQPNYSLGFGWLPEDEGTELIKDMGRWMCPNLVETINIRAGCYNCAGAPEWPTHWPQEVVDEVRTKYKTSYPILFDQQWGMLTDSLHDDALLSDKNPSHRGIHYWEIHYAH